MDETLGKKLQDFVVYLFSCFHIPNELTFLCGEIRLKYVFPNILTSSFSTDSTR